MTVIELSIALALFLMVLLIIVTTFEATQTNFSREASRSTSNDQLRLAVESIDRDVRSGNVLYDPATESYHAGCSTAEFPTCGDIAPGMALRIYTQANSPTRGGPTCVQWRITSGGELQRRSWLSSLTPVSSGWRIIATNVTNRADNVAAFSRSAAVQASMINIDLRTNANRSYGSTVEVTDSVEGRNTAFAPNTQPCGPVTPDPTIVTVPPVFPLPAY